MPTNGSGSNVLTSAVLFEGTTGDRLVLYVHGDEAAKLELPAGTGAKLLVQIGLERVL